MTTKQGKTVSVDIDAFNRGVDSVLTLEPLRRAVMSISKGQTPFGKSEHSIVHPKNKQAGSGALGVKRKSA